MKTQVSIYVKNASIFSRLWSFLWFINIFKKMSVNAYIDSKDTPPQRLKARSEPYLIDLAPGSHTIVFADPKAGEKKLGRWLTGAFVGSAFGLAGGMDSALTAGSAWGKAFAGNQAHDDAVQFSLREGEVLKIQVQPKLNGSVKTEFL